MRTADTIMKVGILTPCNLLVLAACFCFSALLPAQSSSNQTSGAGSDESTSRTETIESQAVNINAIRTVVDHTKSGNRTVDKRSLQRRGSNESFEPYQDIETETVQVNANTVRIIMRTFGRDSDGAKTLVQVMEEERRTSPSGDSNIVRSTQNPDANGRLTVVQRQVEETKKSGKDVEETKTTVMLPSGNGDLAPAFKTEEHHRKRADGTVESQKTTLLPDINGNWQIGEVQRATTRQEGKDRRTERTTSRTDLDGHLGEVSQTISKESESASGETKSTVETYSVDVPGSARDGEMHPVERITTTRHTGPTGEKTTEQVEQPVPGDLESGMRVATVSVDTVTSGPSGARSKRTIQARDASGGIGEVTVDTTQRDQKTEVQVQIAPPEKKK